MRSFLLAFLTLNLFLYWDLLIRIRYIFRPRNIEKYVDNLFHKICRILFSLTGMLVNVHIKFEKDSDKKLPDVFLLICNHQSIQDIPLLIWSFPDKDLRFSAKDSLFRGIPMVSLMLRLQKHGRIERNGSVAQTMQTLERVAVKSGEGYCPVVFPEGTRSRDGRLGHFHHGAVRKMLSTSPVPVVTAAIEGGWRVGDVKGLATNMKDFDYHVKILDIYEAPASKREIQEILETARERIQKQVESWQNEDRNNPKIKKGCHSKP